MVVLDTDLRILFIDRTTLHILGGPPLEALVDGPISRIHSAQTQERIADLVRQAREAQRPVPFSLKLVTRTGEDRFILVKVLPMLDPRQTHEPIGVLLYDITHSVAAEHRLVRIPVSVKDEIRLLKPEEVTFARAANIYSEVCTATGTHHCDLSLGNLEKRLPADNFFRIHRSYMVNVLHVRRVDRDHLGCVVECDGSEVHLPVSRDRASAFVSRLGLK